MWPYDYAIIKCIGTTPTWVFCFRKGWALIMDYLWKDGTAKWRAGAASALILHVSQSGRRPSRRPKGLTDPSTTLTHTEGVEKDMGPSSLMVTTGHNSHVGFQYTLLEADWWSMTGNYLVRGGPVVISCVLGIGKASQLDNTVPCNRVHLIRMKVYEGPLHNGNLLGNIPRSWC